MRRRRPHSWASTCSSTRSGAPGSRPPTKRSDTQRMHPADPRPVVAVLFGGRSSEHSVSCVTAAGVLGALDEQRYRVLPIGMTREGVCRIVEEARDFRFDPAAMPEVVDDGTEIVFPLDTRRAPLRVVQQDGTVEDIAVVDVFFPVLHGPYGEDGTVQGLFELMDVP